VHVLQLLTVFPSCSGDRRAFQQNTSRLDL
jgi:hypothetical protein